MDRPAHSSGQWFGLVDAAHHVIAAGQHHSHKLGSAHGGGGGHTHTNSYNHSPQPPLAVMNTFSVSDTTLHNFNLTLPYSLTSTRPLTLSHPLTLPHPLTPPTPSRSYSLTSTHPETRTALWKCVLPGSCARQSSLYREGIPG